MAGIAPCGSWRSSSSQGLARSSGLAASVLPKAGRYLNLDFFHLLRIFQGADFLEDVGVHDQRLQVVANGFDVDVLVDEFEGLRAKCVPQQLTVAARRLDGLINLGEPAIVSLEWAEHWVGRQCFP